MRISEWMLTSQRVNESTNLYGLIGYPLGHSFSPAYFSEKFLREGINAVYAAFPIADISELPHLIASHPQLRGLNVTTPYKQTVIPFLDAISDDARTIGAVNCIAVKRDKLSGYNTDWTGFRDSLQLLLQPHHRMALVLGNGGASLAVRYALSHLNIPFHTVSETKGKADFLYRDILPEIFQQHTIIINTTVLGTEGNGIPQLPYEVLTPRHLLYDLVYNPAVTSFLKEGIRRGSTVKNGQEMLGRQAEASWDIWQSGA